MDREHSALGNEIGKRGLPWIQNEMGSYLAIKRGDPVFYAAHGIGRQVVQRISAQQLALQGRHNYGPAVLISMPELIPLS